VEQLTVPATPTSARTARRFVSAFCTRQRLPQETCEDAVLLVSEVVGNSLRHARSEARIRVDLIGRVLRVEVADDRPELPQLRNAPADATDGRGVRILDEVAKRWGADRRTVPPPGKVVWFELAGA
jgi:anti-sigma regulatory factor (Ser/Thr protein kinase)